MAVGSVSLGLRAAPLFAQDRSVVDAAAQKGAVAPPDASGNRIAAAESWLHRPYRSRMYSNGDVSGWIMLDLGSVRLLDSVQLFPAKGHVLAGESFPLRFRIEASRTPDFTNPQIIADRSKADYPDPQDEILSFAARRLEARYLRLAIDRLRPGKVNALLQMVLPEDQLDRITQATGRQFRVALAKISVMSDGRDVAQGCHVAVSESLGLSSEASQLTRPARPMGESLVTDNLANVTLRGRLKRVADKVRTPIGGIIIGAGVFKTALENNVAYLLATTSTHDLVREFRIRAGKPVGAAELPHHNFWVDLLAGSNSGRFLMGAANAVRWMPNPELSARIKAVVDGIADCRQPNGYIMAYPEDTFFVSERGAYVRSWVTQGLIEAGISGQEKAWGLLRGYYDWFNASTNLPTALRGCIQGGQGMVANARVHLSPVGRPEDIDVLQHYFQEDFWLDALARREPEAIWQYPYDRPHVYLLTNLEAYLDLYRATGDERYRSAVEGGWHLFKDNWQNIGGSFAIIELQKNEPRSYPLYEKLGETCGSAFWILLNQRLHRLAPDEERYTAEIETTLYNVILANQAGATGIRYHTMLVGQKEAAQASNTCCEGQGSRILGSLPEFLFSIADDGIWVNLFAAATIDWRARGKLARLTMDTRFPEDPEVAITVDEPPVGFSTIRLRVPSWAKHPVVINVNGERAALGSVGSYVSIGRRWKTGDLITFTLPMEMRIERYTGVDQIEGRERFALFYGPLLMAAIGQEETELDVNVASHIDEMLTRLTPVDGKPLEFATIAPFQPWARFTPYFKVQDEAFSCVPVIKVKEGFF